MNSDSSPDARLVLIALMLLCTLSVSAQVPLPSAGLPGSVPSATASAAAPSAPSGSATLAPDVGSAPGPGAGSPASPASSPGQVLAPVVLHGLTILRVPSSADLTSQERADLLTTRLSRVLEVATGPPSVTLVQVNSQPVLSSEGIILVTVTGTDASAAGYTRAELASLYRDQLERGLVRAWQERQAPYKWQASLKFIGLVALGVALHLLLRPVIYRYLQLPGWLILACMWLWIVDLAAWQFPVARSLCNAIEGTLLRPSLRIGTIVLVAIALGHYAHHVLRAYFGIVTRVRSDVGPGSRWQQRASMIEQAVLVIIRVIVAIVTVVAVVNELNLTPPAFLASAGFIGVGLGVAFQDIIKDWISGIFILGEDLFGVGDQIRSGPHEGRVEAFTMRATRLRNADGTMICVPNAALRTVENLTNLWSQVDLRVTIPHHADLQKAMEVMAGAGSDPLEGVIDAPLAPCIHEITTDGVVLRMLLKTEPHARYRVKTQLLERVKTRFENAGIGPPVPQRVVELRNAPVG